MTRSFTPGGSGDDHGLDTIRDEIAETAFPFRENAFRETWLILSEPGRCFHTLIGRDPQHDPDFDLDPPVTETTP